MFLWFNKEPSLTVANDAEVPGSTGLGNIHVGNPGSALWSTSASLTWGQIRCSKIAKTLTLLSLWQWWLLVHDVVEN